MYAQLLQILDRVAIQTACRSMDREGPPPGPIAPGQPLPHPDYLAAVDDAHIEVAFDGHGGFSYPSPLPSPAAANNTVRGRFVDARPTRRDPQRKPPLAILLHGWNGEQGYRYQFPLLARRLAGLGVAVALPELPYHGSRKPRRRPRNFLSADLDHTMAAARQAIADVRALIHWAQRQGYESIGLWGVSLGAWLAGLIACAEPTLRGLVLMTPVPSMDRAIDQLPFCRALRDSLARTGTRALGLNLAEYRPALAPRRILLVESRYDLFAPADTVEALWRAWDRPEIWRVRHGHISVLMSLPINDRAVRWLRDRLTEAPVPDRTEP